MYTLPSLATGVILVSFGFMYDAGSGTVGPVVIRSRIRWNVEPVPLNPNFRVIVAPGCPWKDRVVVTEKEIIEAGKAVRFTVALKGTFTLGQYEALIGRKEPVRLAVTLYPLAAPVPTIGVPVPTGPGPMTDTVVIAPPDFSPAAFELAPEPVPDASDGTPMTALAARLTFPDLIVPTDAEITDLSRQDWFRVVSPTDRVGLVNEQAEGGGKRALFRAHGLAPGTPGNDSFDVGVSVRVAGRVVGHRTTLTLVPKKTYVLRVSADHLSVSRGRPAAFHALLLEETAPGKEVPVPKAVLVTGFDPRGGPSLDPFDPGSVVVIVARLDPGPGATLGERERSATIRFDAVSVDGVE